MTKLEFKSDILKFSNKSILYNFFIIFLMIFFFIYKKKITKTLSTKYYKEN